MRTAFWAAVFVILLPVGIGCAAAPQAAPPQTTPPPQSKQQSSQEQKPVSLSPLIPIPDKQATDPAKMAEGPAVPGKLTGGVPVGEAYVIGPEDVVKVSVWEERNFNGSYLVRPDGRISIPLLGEIVANGLTPTQLEEAINQAAGKFLTVTHSSVQIEHVGSKKIYFDGEGIASPGAMEYIVPIKILDAISARGSLKEFANRKNIKVLRDGKPLRTVNYNDIIKGKHPEQNIFLLPGDHVIVN